MREIMVTNAPAQDFATVLNKVAYDMHVQWNALRGVWTLDLTDGATKSILAVGIPLLVGVNVLDAFALDIGGIFCFDMSGSNTDAGEDDLGDRVKVVYLTPRELGRA